MPEQERIRNYGCSIRPKSKFDGQIAISRS